MYSKIFKPLIFILEAEEAHNLVCAGLKLAQVLPGMDDVLQEFFGFEHSSLRQHVLGKMFVNPVGLAAGFDKNIQLAQILPSFGFGFLECGTVTAKAQDGNPSPRMFRLVQEQALLNRLGFNNDGAEAIAARLGKKNKFVVPLGINLGKSKITPMEDAVEDYLFSFEKLFRFADYVTINVSSPNTPNLRELQHNLKPLLAALQEKNKELAALHQQEPKPLLVKIAPDLTEDQIYKIADTCAAQHVSGLIATNTTIDPKFLNRTAPLHGGLSGRPLFARSTEVLRQLYKHLHRKMVLIGVGGIFSAEDAYQKIKAGASLTQIYTGWVYNGPGFAAKINRGLVKLLKRDGFKNIQEAVGVESD